MIKFQATKFSDPTQMEKPTLTEGLKGVIVYRDVDGVTQLRIFGDLDEHPKVSIYQELADIAKAIPKNTTVQRWSVDKEGLTLYLRKFAVPQEHPE